MEPGPRPGTKPAGGVSSHFQWLQCDACDQQRRVDDATFHLFHNDTWNSDASARRRSKLLEALPLLECRLCDWLMHVHAEQRGEEDNAEDDLCVDTVDAFLEGRGWRERRGWT